MQKMGAGCDRLRTARVERLEGRVLLSASYFGPQQTLALPPSSMPSPGGDPRSVAVADLNGDGKADIVVGEVGGITVFMGDGNGTFQAGKSYPIDAQGELESIQAVDLNGDGVPDLAMVDDISGRLYVAIGIGDGTFRAATSYSTGSGPVQLVVADVAQNGRADLIVPCITGNEVDVFLNKGNAILNERSYNLPNFAASAVVDDINGDGIPDIIVGSDRYSFILNGYAGGSFALQSKEIYTGINVVTQIDSAGSVDVVGGGGALAGFGNDVVISGNGDGTFRTVQTFSGLVQGAIDVNGDGVPDLLTPEYAPGTAYVSQGNANGTFAAAQMSSYAAHTFIAVGDVNGDGLPDLVYANTRYITVTFLLNTTGATPLLSYTDANGILTATGIGDRPDNIVVTRLGGLLTISDSGVANTFPAAGLKQINIDSGAGNDIVYINKGIGIPVSVNGGAGADSLFAHGPDVTLAGGRGSDSIRGAGVNDLFIGGRGNDTLVGGSGATETLQGGAGNDSLTGGGLLIGGMGSDTIVM